jgi:hypothetical protein
MDDQNSNVGEAPRVNRFLVFAVYFMGAVLVLLFLGLIGGIIYKIKNRVALPTGTGLVELGLSAGAQVREAILTGDKLTINTGTEVFIVEVSSRKVLLRVKASSP